MNCYNREKNSITELQTSPIFSDITEQKIRILIQTIVVSLALSKDRKIRPNIGNHNQ